MVATVLEGKQVLIWSGCSTTVQTTQRLFMGSKSMVPRWARAKAGKAKIVNFMIADSMERNLKCETRY